MVRSGDVEPFCPQGNVQASQVFTAFRFLVCDFAKLFFPSIIELFWLSNVGVVACVPTFLCEKHFKQNGKYL